LLFDEPTETMKQLVEQLLSDALSKLKSDGNIPSDFETDIKVERTKDPVHGDFATNLALAIAKPCRQNPRQLAELLRNALETHPSLERVEIAGPGFINFFMQEDAVANVVKTVLSQGDQYGRSNLGQGQKVIIEFVSSNPTGPLHVGHGRGAAFGASLANVLDAAGFDVSREYYVNDAGRQMSILAVSVWLRYLSLAGESIVFPVNAYRGDYVSDIAQRIFDQEGSRYVHPWATISADMPEDEPQGGDKEVYIDELVQRMKHLIGDDGLNFFIVKRWSMY
jgi:arginyl-tRNA synthetase